MPWPLNDHNSFLKTVVIPISVLSHRDHLWGESLECLRDLVRGPRGTQVGEQNSDWTLGKRKHVTWTHFVLRLWSPAFQSLIPPTLTFQNKKWRNYMFNKKFLSEKSLFCSENLAETFSPLQKPTAASSILSTTSAYPAHPLTYKTDKVPSLWQLAGTRS